jgi:hypothetical protein
MAKKTPLHFTVTDRRTILLALRAAIRYQDMLIDASWPDEGDPAPDQQENISRAKRYIVRFTQLVTRMEGDS